MTSRERTKRELEKMNEILRLLRKQERMFRRETDESDYEESSDERK